MTGIPPSGRPRIERTVIERKAGRAGRPVQVERKACGRRVPFTAFRRAA